MIKSTIDLESLQVFKTVIDCGSFTAAGELLLKDKAQVSRTVSRLEARLKVQLLTRSTRRLSITELGRELYERAENILKAVEETELRMADGRSEPSGLLRISAGAEFGHLRVSAWVSSYLHKYPGVHVELDFSDRLADMIHEGLDVAIRVGGEPEGELSGRVLGELKYGLYASPGYLSEYEPPSKLDDLSLHSLVMFSPRGKAQWRLRRGAEKSIVRARPRCVLNSHRAALDLVLSGHGISLLPDFLAEKQLRDGSVQRILEDWSGEPAPVFAIFPSSRYLTANTKSFVDFVMEQF